MAGEVVAIGPLCSSVRTVLSLGAALYEGVADGSVVLDSLFHDFGSCGSRATRALCGVLAVDPWDFNTHVVNADVVDVVALRTLVGDADADRFLALRAAGFSFYFRPNG